MRLGTQLQSNAFGLVCVVVSLFFDGWLGYEEDNVKVTYSAGPIYLMASTNLYSALLSFACIPLY